MAKAKQKAKPKQVWVVVEHASGLMRVRGVHDAPFKAKEAAKPIDGRVAGPFRLNGEVLPESKKETTVTREQQEMAATDVEAKP